MKTINLIRAKDVLEKQIFESVMVFELDTGLTVNSIRPVHDGRIKTNRNNIWKDRLETVTTEIILSGSTC